MLDDYRCDGCKLVSKEAPPAKDGEGTSADDGAAPTVQVRKQLLVGEPPRVLILTLKRYTTGRYGKISRPIAFDETLDLSPFVVATPRLERPSGAAEVVAEAEAEAPITDLAQLLEYIDKTGFGDFMKQNSPQTIGGMGFRGELSVALQVSESVYEKSELLRRASRSRFDRAWQFTYMVARKGSMIS